MRRVLFSSLVFGLLGMFAYCFAFPVLQPPNPEEEFQIVDEYEEMPGQGPCLIDDGNWDCTGQNQDTCLNIFQVPNNAMVGDACGSKTLYQNTTPPKVKRVPTGYYRDSLPPWNDVCYTVTDCKIARNFGIKTCDSKRITFYHVPRVIVNYCDPCPNPNGGPLPDEDEQVINN
jgi:hypothetical protein